MTCRRTSLGAALVAALLVGCGAQKDVREARVRYSHIPSEAYAVVAEIRAKPGMEDELRKATLPLVAQVRNEPNDRIYFLHEDRKEPASIFACARD
ncbi:MAG: antibiotic biosynthesis monooxygenase [Pseudomonadota bacterium]